MKKSLPLWLAGLAFLLVPQRLPLEDAPPQLSRSGPAQESPAPETALIPPLPPEPAPVVPAPVVPRRADFAGEAASHDTRHLANWVLESQDHEGRPFAIIDKVEARVFVFDADGRLQGTAPALLGLARGDDSVPGIGERPVPDILPHERTTPAGRFVAEPGRNTSGEDIVWVDYEAAISMHRVRAIDPRERRLERLASPTPEDNRISYGCINLPASFYDTVLSPMIGASRGIVYVLPETRPVSEVFGTHESKEPKVLKASLEKREADDAFWQAMMKR